MKGPERNVSGFFYFCHRSSLPPGRWAGADKSVAKSLSIMGYRKFIGKVKTVFGFTSRERRAILLLLPLLVVLFFIIRAALNPPTGDNPDPAPSPVEDISTEQRNPVTVNEIIYKGTDQAHFEAATATSPELFFFDPNTVSLQQLVKLGFTARTAAGIIKYRERGKVFEIPEDFATCYGVTMDDYTRLEPYIRIGEQFRVKKFASRDPVVLATPAVHSDTATTEGNDNGAPHLREGVTSLRPLIELNGADSTTLRSITGIGEVLVVRIMEYRDLLGGFSSVWQLAEVRGMYESNYERIITQIYVDPGGISKIDINFADQKALADRLGKHPYGGDRLVRKILKERQLKGGWSNTQELVDQNIISPEQAAKLAPYLIFN